jgi:hypothetical protein
VDLTRSGGSSERLMKLCGMLPGEAQSQRIIAVAHARFSPHPARSKDTDPRLRPCRCGCLHHREDRISRGSLSGVHSAIRAGPLPLHEDARRPTLARYPVTVSLRVRRYFCEETSCRRTIFAERLPGIAARYDRRIERLNSWFTHVSFVLGGQAGSRLLKDLGITSESLSPETPY